MPKTPSKTSSSSSGSGTGSAVKTSPPGSRAGSPTPSVATLDQEIKLDKVKITPFSDAKDWESTLFELKLVLRQVWRDKTLDIARYITDETYAASVYGTPSQKKADELIYYVLSTGSVHGSFARNAIIAALNKTAQPHIADNEGLDLLLYFNNIFVFHDEHATSLPIAQQKFHSLKQKNNESANTYIARVDLAVSSLSKLGEPGSFAEHLDFRSCKRPTLRI